MKKVTLSVIISVVLVLCLGSLCVCASAAGVVTTNVGFFINGNRISLERDPVAINGRILAPARTVFANFGARVDWYPEKGYFNIVKGNTVISMTIGQNAAKVNNVSMQSEVPPILERGTVMVPVRFVAEILNIPVDWDSVNNAVLMGNRNEIASISRGEKKYIVVIDPGHGGWETGAAYGGIKEKDLNLDISLKLKALLQAEGITVHMTRSSDTRVGLSQRAELANRLNADMFISIHNNASTTPGVAGTMTLYYPYSTAYKNNLSSKTLASIVQNEVSRSLGSRNIGIIQRTDLTVLRVAKVPAVLVEVGYMSNSNELNKLKNDAYRQKAAETIKNAIIKALYK